MPSYPVDYRGSSRNAGGGSYGWVGELIPPPKPTSTPASGGNPSWAAAMAKAAAAQAAKSGAGALARGALKAHPLGRAIGLGLDLASLLQLLDRPQLEDVTRVQPADRFDSTGWTLGEQCYWPDGSARQSNGHWVLDVQGCFVASFNNMIFPEGVAPNPSVVERVALVDFYHDQGPGQFGSRQGLVHVASHWSRTTTDEVFVPRFVPSPFYTLPVVVPRYEWPDPLTNPRLRPGTADLVGLGPAPAWRFLPGRGVNPYRDPREQTTRGPQTETATQTQTRPAFPQVPQGPTIIHRPPVKRTPPGPGVKEKKLNTMPGWARAVSKVFQELTEGCDAAESLFGALPKMTQKIYDAQRRADKSYSKCAMHAMAVVENWGLIDWNEAAKNIAKNYVEDKVIGGLNKAAGKTKPITRGDGPFGIGLGPGL